MILTRRQNKGGGGSIGILKVCAHIWGNRGVELRGDWRVENEAKKRFFFNRERGDA